MSFEKDQAWQKLQDAAAEFTEILKEEGSEKESIFVIATRVMPEEDLPEEAKEHLKLHRDIEPDAEIPNPLMSMIVIGGSGGALIDAVSHAMTCTSEQGPGKQIKHILMGAALKSTVDNIVHDVKKARSQKIGEDILSQIIKEDEGDKEFNAEGGE